MTATLSFVPERAQYAATDSVQVNTKQVDGGLPRTRRDIVGSTTQVQCQWILSSADYETLYAFYLARITSLADFSFNASLILDNPEIETFLCTFMPGTWQLLTDSFDTKTVQAMLEASPLTVDPIYNNSFIDVYGTYLEGSAPFISRLTQFANVDLALL